MINLIVGLKYEYNYSLVPQLEPILYVERIMLHVFLNNFYKY